MSSDLHQPLTLSYEHGSDTSATRRQTDSRGENPTSARVSAAGCLPVTHEGHWETARFVYGSGLAPGGTRVSPARSRGRPDPAQSTGSSAGLFAPHIVCHPKQAAVRSASFLFNAEQATGLTTDTPRSTLREIVQYLSIRRESHESNTGRNDAEHPYAGYRFTPRQHP